MNAEAVAALIVGIAEAYLIAGLLFAVMFALFLAPRLDPATRGATWGFRLMVIPGAALLWPLLVSRLLRRRGVPQECTAHRRCGDRSDGGHREPSP